MPSLVVDIVTLRVLTVGFVLGCYWRGWSDRVEALRELRGLGDQKKLAGWLREADRRH